jgi:hypothetical protein
MGSFELRPAWGKSQAMAPTLAVPAPEGASPESAPETSNAWLAEMLGDLQEGAALLDLFSAAAEAGDGDDGMTFTLEEVMAFEEEEPAHASESPR